MKNTKKQMVMVVICASLLTMTCEVSATNGIKKPPYKEAQQASILPNWLFSLFS